MKILVTGTAGFIGMHLAIRLASNGHEVIGLDNINSYYDANLKYARLGQQGIKREDILYNKLLQGHSNIQFVEIDLMDAGNLNALFAKHRFEMVINLAAQAGVRYSITNPKDYIDSNITGFYNILEATRNFDVGKLIFASSSSVYGNNTKTPFLEEDNTDLPISFYAATKKSNELMAHTYSHLYGIRTTGLRFFTVYGPWGRPDMALFMFTKNILEDKPIKVFNQGDLLRDFTYIDDTISGVENIVNDYESADSYNVFNIGSSKPVKLLDFISAIEKCLGKKAQLEMLPMQEGDVKVTYADTSKIREKYNYKPAAEISTGIEKFVDWYKNFYSYN
ncbi:MAG: NAD-dependent epimerase/dehydratase family protein [Ginsengibacter sp.]